MILSSFRIGIERAIRNWKMAVLLAAASIFIAAPVALLVLTVVTLTTSGKPAANRLLSDNLDVIWLIDLINEQFPGTSLTTIVTELGFMLVLLGVFYLITNVFFAGGIIEVLSTRDGDVSMRRFWSGAGAYFWRFCRLWLISLAAYSAIFIIYSIALATIGSFGEGAIAEAPGAIKKWGATAILVLALAIVNMIFDYARIGTVVNSSHKMFRETVRAVRFVAHRFLPACSLYLMVALMGAALFWLLTLLRSAVDQSSVILVIIAIALGQVAIAAKIWSRLVFYAAQLNLYQQLVPTVELVPPVVRVTPEFAAAIDLSSLETEAQSTFNVAEL